MEYEIARKITEKIITRKTINGGTKVIIKKNNINNYKKSTLTLY